MSRDNVDTLLTQITKQLQLSGLDSARLDALVLLEDVLNINRAHLLAHLELEVSTEQQQALNKLVQRRMSHEPLAYIRNKSEFYGRPFYVDQRVLVPRPETEAMIDLLVGVTLPQHPAIADIGTGSGVLAITAALELPQSRVLGIDIDRGCLQVASKNAHELGAHVTFIEGDLTEPLSLAKVLADVLLCNLPYVPEQYPINKAAGHEPRTAIFGGKDGLSFYRGFFMGLKYLPAMPVYIFTESLPSQHPTLEAIAVRSGYFLKETMSYVQLFAMS